MKIYYSDKCPDCTSIRSRIEEEIADYEIVEITESMANLKEFLRLRDSREEFKSVREAGNVGIPCFLKDNGDIVFSLDEATGK